MSEKLKERVSWDQYFMGVLAAVRERGTCDRGKSGAVIAIENRILTTGYVGAAKGLPHCDEVGHLMREVIDENGKHTQHCMRTVHAEENAILQAARNGVSIKGATLYCTMTPCYRCAMQIVQVGIVRVVANKRYHAGHLSEDLFDKAGIELVILNNEVEQYSRQ